MNKITFDEAMEHISKLSPVYSKRVVSLQDAVGQILAEPIFAKYSVPPSPVSAMDGFAVCASDTASASNENPLTLKKFARVNTGNVVKTEFDAVIMVEDVEFKEPTDSTPIKEITIRSPIKSGRNVRATGEDIEKGRLVLPAGSKIRPFDVGALAGYGITDVTIRSISVGIIPTGSELIEPGQVPKDGEVVESNSIMTEAYLRQFGVNVIRYRPVSDNPDLIHQAIEQAISENEIVLLSAGSSMGSKDFTSRVIQSMGTLVFHGVFMKPAKPSMLGLINGKPVIGMPGFPLSAQTTQRLFVRQLLKNWGCNCPEQETIDVVAGDDVGSDTGIDEFRFATVANVAGRIVALPQIRSSSMQMNGIRANCYLHIPRGKAGVKTGETVSAVLNVSLAELSQTILLGGLYSEGSEYLSVMAANAGTTIRFGDVSETKLSLLVNKSCHGMCVKDDTDLSVLTQNNIEFETIHLCDDTMLVVRSDMNDSLTLALKNFAKTLEGD